MRGEVLGDSFFQNVIFCISGLVRGRLKGKQGTCLLAHVQCKQKSTKKKKPKIANTALLLVWTFRDAGEVSGNEGRES